MRLSAERSDISLLQLRIASVTYRFSYVSLQLRIAAVTYRCSYVSLQLRIAAAVTSERFLADSLVDRSGAVERREGERPERVRLLLDGCGGEGVGMSISKHGAVSSER